MIPDYQSLMPLVLACASDGPRRVSDVVSEIADRLELTEAERRQMLPSGRQTTLANRVHWARSYLKQAGLVQSPQRGFYELTDRGRAAMNDPDTQVDNTYLDRFDEFRDFRNRSREGDDTGSAGETADVLPSSSLDEANTPDENLLVAHRKLENALAASLLDHARSSSPAFFEQLIVDLFIAMGYGGSSEEAGRALGQSGDNGVDGVIDQDPLGVDQIYLQAKRYAAGNNVGPGEIRDFYGALSIHRASKGIYVTTSNFTPAARQTARELGQRIVLINGSRLASLMIRYNIGCRYKDVLHIRQIDESYFDQADG